MREIEIIIEGYNQEKNILTNRLSQLQTNNSNIALRSSIEGRLREIDKCIKDLLPTNNKTDDK